MRIEGKCAVTGFKIETELAACSETIEFFLAQLADTRTDQCRTAEICIDGIFRVECAIAGAEANLDRYPSRFGIVRPQDGLHAIGEFNLFNIENADRSLSSYLARLTDCGQIFERHGATRQARTRIGCDRLLECRSYRLLIRLTRCRGDIGRTDNIARKQRPRMFEHEFRRQSLLHRIENGKDRFWSSDRFANIDSVHNIVGQLRPGQDAPLLDLAFENNFEFRKFSIDFFLRRRSGQRIGDYAANIIKRRFPVAGQRSESDEGHV